MSAVRRNAFLAIITLVFTYCDAMTDVAKALEVIMAGANGERAEVKTPATYVLTEDPMAKCLDGSQYGYFLCPETGGSEWLIWMQGGGWCYTDEECYARARTAKGRSESGTHKCPDPKHTKARVVFMEYCDGASFSGSVAQPVKHNGKEIYYRGLNNFDGTIAHLQKHHGLSEASRVVLGGSSAGGLATFYHLDRLMEKLPGVDLLGVPVSGFFLDYKSVFSDTSDKPSFADGAIPAAQMQNSQAVILDDCRSQFKPAESYKCLFPQDMAMYIRPRWFAINSAYDEFSLRYIAMVPCVNKDGNKRSSLKKSSCSKQEDDVIRDFGNKFLELFNNVIKDDRVFNGGYISSCISHGTFLGEINGKDSIEAFDEFVTQENKEIKYISKCGLAKTDGPCSREPICLPFPGGTPVPDGWDAYNRGRGAGALIQNGVTIIAVIAGILFCTCFWIRRRKKTPGQTQRRNRQGGGKRRRRISSGRGR
mmetsp:Transcript_17344/g.34605  ORF Transcript_17344/g.34605 Transcript_17344/m.34605 type:complete len:479 (-) Transcript_17344:192-1628(-)